MGYNDNGEQRQHISMSIQTFQTLEFDAHDFRTNITGLINTLIERFPEQDICQADIEHAVDIKRSSYINSLSEAGDFTADLQKIAEKLSNDYRRDLEKKFKKLPTEKSLKIRLNNQNFRNLYPEKCEDVSDGEMEQIKADGPFWRNEGYYQAPINYIKAIIADYASHSQAEREAIYFHDLIDQIQAEIDSAKHHLLRVINIEAHGRRGKHLIKPYAIMRDAEGDYNYIVCISKSLNPAYKGKAEFKPVSYRLSRVEKITQAAPSAGSGRITATEKKELERRLRESGVGFLVREACNIKVRLTSSGMERYSSLSHLRPYTKSIEDSPDGQGKILTIFCTQTQALIYFKPFGSEAEVISPEELRDQLNNFYQEASESYSK